MLALKMQPPSHFNKQALEKFSARLENFSMVLSQIHEVLGV
jgi:hypothetical protein